MSSHNADRAKQPLTCEEVQPLLVSFLHKEEDEQCHVDIDHHISHCDNCSALLTAIRGNLQTLDKAPEAAAPKQESWRAISTMLDLTSTSNTTHPAPPASTFTDAVLSETNSPSRSVSWWRLLSPLLFITIIALLIYAWRTAHDTPDQARAELTTRGDIQWRTSTDTPWRAIDNKTFLTQGQSLLTGEDAEVFLLLPDNGKLQLMENSQLIWPDDGPIELVSGWLQVTLPAAGKLNLKTAQSIQESEHGHFLLRTTSDKTVLTVIQGLVTMTNEKGTVQVQQSQQSVAVPGQRPSPPTLVDISTLQHGEDVGELNFTLSMEVPETPYEKKAYIPVTTVFMNRSKHLIRLPRLLVSELDLVLEITAPDGSTLEKVIPYDSIREGGQAEFGEAIVSIGYQKGYVVGFMYRDGFPKSGEYILRARYRHTNPGSDQLWTGSLESNPVIITIKE